MAREFFHYKVMRKSIIKFLSIFDDMKIAKYDNQGNISKHVDVKVKYMPKKKWYSWLYERSHEKRLPMIGVELTSMKYDKERASGQLEKINVSIGQDSNTYTTNAVPYNLGFRVSVATEYMNEMDQISENLLPFFTPFVYTNVAIDELNIDWDMQVMFDGANIETESDIAEDDYRNILWTFDFTAKTYLLKPTADISVIKKIIHNFYLSDNSWDNRTYTEMPSGQGNEDEQLLILGSKEDDKILAEYMVFNN